MRFHRIIGNIGVILTFSALFSTFFFLLNKILIIYAVVLFDKTKTKPTFINIKNYHYEQKTDFEHITLNILLNKCNGTSGFLLL